MMKRISSILLILTLLLSALPASGAAATAEGSEAIVGEIRVQALSDTLIRIEKKGPEGFEDRLTYHVASRDWAGVAMTRTEQNGLVRLSTNLYTIELPENAASLIGIRVYNRESRLIWTCEEMPESAVALPAPGNTPAAFAVSDSPRIVPAEWGYAPAPAENTENTATNGWDLGNDAPDVYLFLPAGDAHVLRQDFNRLFGSSEMVKLKNLGLWQSRYMKYTDQELLALIEQFRAAGFPVDNLVVDTDWRVGSSTGYEVNTDYFPDLAAFMEKAKFAGVTITLNDHAKMVSSGVLDEGEVSYRNENLTCILGQGLDSWWYDRNWTSALQSPVEGISDESFGMYAYQSVEKNFFAQNKTGQYPLRSIILGNVDGVNNGSLDMAPDLSSHRYSIQWTGDTETFERTLEQEIAVMVLEGALYATPYVSDDIGGHRGALPDSNLYARWVQYAALSPIMRFHSGSSRYPWDYPEVEDTVRDYVQLRYRLAPLFYALAHENYETGLPLCRRLDFNYPQYGEAQDNTQYLIGDDILVAPLYTAAGSDTRSVFIPDGTWINAFTGERICGPQTTTVTCDITSSPLFIREGGVIPLADGTVDCLEANQWGSLTLELYPSETADGSALLYEDDTQTTAYQAGEYRTTAVAMTGEQDTTVIRIDAAEGTYQGAEALQERLWKLRVHARDAWGALQQATVNGAAAECVKISCTETAAALAGEGGAADGDVYELLITAPVGEALEVRLQWAHFSKQTIEEPVYSGTAVDWSTTSRTFENGSLEAAGALGFATLKENTGAVGAIAAKGTLQAVETSCTINESNQAQALHEGSFTVEIQVTGTQWTSIYLAGQKAKGAVYISDAGRPAAEAIPIEPISGNFSKCITVQSQGEGTLHIEFCKTDGEGWISLLGVAAADTAPQAGAVNGYLSLDGTGTSLNLSAQDYLDWYITDYQLLGCGNQKADGCLLERAVWTGRRKLAGDCAQTLSWSDAVYDSLVQGMSSTPYTTDGTVLVAAPSTGEWRRLTLYSGFYCNTLVEAFDAQGNVLGKISYANEQEMKKIQLVYRSEEESTVYIRISRLNQTGNNFGLQLYTLERLEESALQAELTLQEAPDQVNLSDEAYADWLHQGYPAAADVNRKKGVTPMIGSVKTAGNTSFGLGKDYKTAFSWTDSTGSDAVSDTHLFAYSFNATKMQLNMKPGEWTIALYLAAWRSTPQVVITDRSGALVGAVSYETQGTASAPKVLQLRYRSEKSEKLSIIFTPASAAGDGYQGNGGLLAATVSGVFLPDDPDENIHDILNFDPANPLDTYEIGSREGYEYFASLVNNGYDMNGITIKLTADLDFEGASVDSIAAVSNSCFRGVFDGQGKTISNISMKNYGLFRYLDGAEIKNLTLENVSNTAPDSYASILAGEAMTDSVNQISDCRLINCILRASNSANALLFGRAENSSLDVRGCTLENCRVIRQETSGTKYNSGIMIGSANTSSTSSLENPKGHQLTVENSAVIGCTLESPGVKLTNVGLVCGLTEFATFRNLILLRNRTDCTNSNASLISGFSEKNGAIIYENCYLYQNEGNSWDYRLNSGAYTASGVYTDRATAFEGTVLVDPAEMSWRMNSVTARFGTDDTGITSDAAWPTRQLIFAAQSEVIRYTGTNGLIADIPTPPDGFCWDFNAGEPATENRVIGLRASGQAGDADGDEALTTADVVLIMQYLNGHPVEINLNNADFNQDGRISIADAVLLLRQLSV